MTLVTVPTLIYGADDKADKAEDQLRHPTFPEGRGAEMKRSFTSFVALLV